MQNIIDISPELLQQQGQQMSSLQNSYNTLLEQLKADLNGFNSSWSPELANNFAGKINCAQQSFSGVLSLLTNASSAVSMAVSLLMDGDSSLASAIAPSLANFSGSFSGGSEGGRILAASGAASVTPVDPAELSPLNALAAEQKEKLLEILNIKEDWQNAEKMQKNFDKFMEEAKKVLTPHERANLERVYILISESSAGDAAKCTVKAAKVMQKLLQGKTVEALGDIGDVGFKDLAKNLLIDNGMDKSEAGTHVDYLLNLFKNGVEGGTELIAEGVSPENLAKIVWNLGPQTVLDTAGEDIFKYCKLVPGIGEMIKENNIKDHDGLMTHTIGEFYEIVSGDDTMGEYVTNYFDQHGGIFEGTWDGYKDMFTYIHENGIQGLKDIGNTILKDGSAVMGNLKDSAEMLGKSLLKGGANGGDSSLSSQIGTGDLIGKFAGNYWHSAV